MIQCAHPSQAWMPAGGSGQLVFRRELADLSKPVNVPCRKCECCAELAGLELAVRVYHDWIDHRRVGCFGTLTYADESLPFGAKLRRQDAVAFRDRLDWRLRQRGSRWRGVLVGEYGDRTQRPHYHFVLLGTDLADPLEHPNLIEHSDGQYISPELRELWPHGQSQVSTMHPNRAKYIAKHFIKSYGVEDAFRMISRRPGVGFGWLRQYWRDCLKGYVTMEGCRMPVPRAYLTHPKFKPYLAELAEARQQWAAAQPVLPWPQDSQRRESKRLNIVASSRLRAGVV